VNDAAEVPLAGVQLPHDRLDFGVVGGHPGRQVLGGELLADLGESPEGLDHHVQEGFEDLSAGLGVRAPQGLGEDFRKLIFQFRESSWVGLESNMFVNFHQFSSKHRRFLKNVTIQRHGTIVALTKNAAIFSKKKFFHQNIL
jgi:hypothetical protein